MSCPTCMALMRIHEHEASMQVTPSVSYPRLVINQLACMQHRHAVQATTGDSLWWLPFQTSDTYQLDGT